MVMRLSNKMLKYGHNLLDKKNKVKDPLSAKGYNRSEL